MIILNSNGTSTIVQNTNEGPFDGHDDTLVGIYNNSGGDVSTIVLSSTKNIFAFDGDGICAKKYGNLIYTWSGTGLVGEGAADCPFLPATSIWNGYDGFDYAGPFTSFSGFSSSTAYKTGNVNFAGGLTTGSTTYFSLENSLNAADFTVAATTTTAPASTTTTAPASTTTTAPASTTTTAPASTTTIASVPPTTPTTAPQMSSTTLPATTVPSLPTTTIASAPPTAPTTQPYIPPASIPSGAPSTGAGGSATSTDSGVVLTASGMVLFAGLAGLALALRRRRRA